ncbi:MAG: L,D-transpeptidase [Hyphomicrobiales bacterium]|nr:L,D-transpeptidase [Hyphomicrobiales bacterium]
MRHSRVLATSSCIFAACLVASAAFADPYYARGMRPYEQSPSALGGGFLEMVARSSGAAAPYPTAVYAAPPAMRAQPLAVQRGVPANFMRQEVDYPTQERPGTIIVDTPSKYLYLVTGYGRALRYGIGVGRPGFTWAGVKSISRKAEWPGWTPPPEMLLRRPDLPRHMEGGPANPLGARALYLGSSLYRIHGTNEPYTIGQNVSSGCIRMMNEDVEDLYDRVHVGTRVVVL